MNDHIREPGFYWVKIGTTWHVGQWFVTPVYCFWLLPGNELPFDISRILEIIEKPLKQPK